MLSDLSDPFQMRTTVKTQILKWFNIYIVNDVWFIPGITINNDQFKVENIPTLNWK